MRNVLQALMVVVALVAVGITGGVFVAEKAMKCDCVPAMKCRCCLCLASDKRPKEINGPDVEPLTEKEFEELQKRLKGDTSRRFPVDAGRIGGMRLDVSKVDLDSYREFKRTHGEDAEPVANTWGDFSGLGP